LLGDGKQCMSQRQKEFISLCAIFVDIGYCVFTNWRVDPSPGEMVPLCFLDVTFKPYMGSFLLYTRSLMVTLNLSPNIQCLLTKSKCWYPIGHICVSFHTDVYESFQR
jgi:hypothetical protein